MTNLSQAMLLVCNSIIDQGFPAHHLFLLIVKTAVFCCCVELITAMFDHE